MRARSGAVLLGLFVLVTACGAKQMQVDEDIHPGTPVAADEDVDPTTPAPSERRVTPQWSYDPDATYAEGDIAARMSLEGIDRDEAIRRFRVEDAVSGIIGPTIDAWWPDTFAGLWISTPPKPFKVNISFTSNAAANVAELREIFPFPQYLRAVQGAMPLSQLLSIQRTMIDDRTDLANGVARSDLPPIITETRGRYDLGTDIPTNNLVVYVERASRELLDAFRSTYTPRIIMREGLTQPD